MPCGMQIILNLEGSCSLILYSAMERLRHLFLLSLLINIGLFKQHGRFQRMSDLKCGGAHRKCCCKLREGVLLPPEQSSLSYASFCQHCPLFNPLRPIRQGCPCGRLSSSCVHTNTHTLSLPAHFSGPKFRWQPNQN